MVDVINLCRNISDGVRPFIPPCSLVSLYAFTNISYLSLPSSVFGISSLLLETHFSLSCYMLLFSLVAVGKNLMFAYPLSDCVQESV